ncbi:hypothetical protein [Halorubrum sp. F4]|uniref:hypothetical protein n=1 Tax=Halorubrum sp. F4 TaxID=2989715 RepID=UPI0024800324|nr:hypothetical protein [Halorubrum sp. F4]
MSDPDGEGTVEGSVEGATDGGDGVEAAAPGSDGHGASPPEEIAEIRAALVDLRETTDRLEGSIDSVRSELESLGSSVDEDVEDLRERFVRLYRDLEGKAEADHEHPETAERLETVAADLETAAERLDGAETRIESVEEALDRLDATVTAVETDVGAVDDRVANAEERLSTAEDRLEELTAADEDRSEKLSRVASAVVRTQRELRAVRRDRADQERLDTLLRTANRHGVRKADCGGCENTVRLSLLSTPECPFCEARFDDLDPADRFYRRSTLTVDDRPALEGDVAPDEPARSSSGPGDGTPPESSTGDGEASGGEASGGEASGEGIRRDDEPNGGTDRGGR